MYELYTPKEIIKEMVEVVERERRSQNLQQKTLAQKASIPLPTYREFVYNHKISLENLLKLMFALKLFKNIEGMLHKKSYESIKEIKQKDNLPKRIRK
jgi:ribosome-binding protein aMBF1 (putative translation factor)